jgi:hypothetical protein
VTWRRFNAGATVGWLVLIAPAYLLGWLASVPFVSAISIYANVTGHLAAWRADENSDLIARLDRIEQMLETLIADQPLSTIGSPA